MSDPKVTLDKIQKEIRDTLKREDELRNGYGKMQNGQNKSGSNLKQKEEVDGLSRPNGIPQKVNGEIPKTNGILSKPKSNGFIRRFTPNTTSRGVMQKFFKNRGKVNMSPIKTVENNNGWFSDAAFEPAKVTIEKGKPLRNGFIPAEEKIERELYDFQQREAELRKQRRKSQPDLMAALVLEDENSSDWEGSFKEFRSLKQAKSMANLYQPEDEEVQSNNSAPCSLKPARSLAELCDLSDDEDVEIQGTHSLIMQFENMRTKEGCA